MARDHWIEFLLELAAPDLESHRPSLSFTGDRDKIRLSDMSGSDIRAAEDTKQTISQLALLAPSPLFQQILQVQKSLHAESLIGQPVAQIISTLQYLFKKYALLIELLDQISQNVHVSQTRKDSSCQQNLSPLLQSQVEESRQAARARSQLMGLESVVHFEPLLSELSFFAFKTYFWPQGSLIDLSKEEARAAQFFQIFLKGRLPEPKIDFRELAVCFQVFQELPVLRQKFELVLRLMEVIASDFAQETEAK